MPPFSTAALEGESGLSVLNQACRGRLDGAEPPAVGSGAARQTRAPIRRRLHERVPAAGTPNGESAGSSYLGPREVVQSFRVGFRFPPPHAAIHFVPPPHPGDF